MIDRVLSNPSEYVILVPNFERVVDIKRKLFMEAKKDAIIIPAISTPKTLARSLTKKAVINPVEKLAFAIQTLENSGLNPSSIIKIAKIFISKIPQFRHYNINTDYARKKIEDYNFSAESTKERCILFIEFLEKYNSFLEKKNMIDENDVFLEARQVKKKVILDSFIDFTPLEAEFIKKISDEFYSFVLDESFIPQNYEAEKNRYTKTLKFLNEIGEVEKIKPVLQNKSYYIFPTDVEEVKFIAKSIVSMLKEKSPYDIMVIFPTINAYRKLIKRIFESYSIPIRILPGVSLVDEPAFRSLIDVFELYESPDIHKFLNVITSCHFSLYHIFKKHFSELEYIDVDINFIKKYLPVYKPTTLKGLGNALKEIVKKFRWNAQEHLIEVFEEVVAMFDGNYRIKIPSEFLYTLFENFEVERAYGDGVTVTGVFETGGLFKDVIFFGDFSDKSFPDRSILVDYIFPDNLQKEIGIPDFASRISRVRMELFRILAQGRNVIFTYPSYDGSERKTKSIFAFDEEFSSCDRI